MATKYHIHTSGLDLDEYRAQIARNNADRGSHWCYGRTMDSAVRKAKKLTRHLRSDMHVYVVADDGTVLANTTYTSIQGPAPRHLAVARDAEEAR